MTKYNIMAKGATEPLEIEADDFRFMEGGHILFYTEKVLEPGVLSDTVPVLVVNRNAFDLIVCKGASNDA